MANDYSELVEFIGEKFQVADKEMRAFRSEVRKEFNAVHARLAHVDERFDKLQSAVDAYMKLGETYYQERMVVHTSSQDEQNATQADRYFQEMLALGHKVDRFGTLAASGRREGRHQA